MREDLDPADFDLRRCTLDRRSDVVASIEAAMSQTRYGLQMQLGVDASTGARWYDFECNGRVARCAKNQSITRAQQFV
ncbi:MAG: hypothetical protein ABS35_21825 [Kaistia sp. SCN 65-12]|nr:MAG: hypothetical protein ABS35_21825 [Kaistia sp. SCN 65-12]